MNDTIVFFDLDGTITERDTYVAYLLHVLRARPLRGLRCWHLPISLLLFKLGLLNNDRLKQKFLAAILGGLSRTEIEAHTSRFVAVCMRNIVKAGAMARIEAHRGQGHRLVLVTASLDIYAALLGSEIGFDEILSTKAAWNNGRLSGELDGPNLRGEAKLSAVRSLVEHSPPAKTVAYSDHHSDLPLLRFADEGIAVDPTPRLTSLAASYGLPVERWRGRRSPLPSAEN